jgi:hypothetical protein
VREFCELAFAEVNLDYRDYVVVDENFYRPAEVDLLVGDSSKARKVLGWEPHIKFRDLERGMVEEDLRASREATAAVRLRRFRRPPAVPRQPQGAIASVPCKLAEEAEQFGPIRRSLKLRSAAVNSTIYVQSVVAFSHAAVNNRYWTDPFSQVGIVLRLVCVALIFAKRVHAKYAGS